MPITTLKVLSTVLQLHGPGATIQSDHQGIDAVLNDLRRQDDAQATEIYFRRGFVRAPATVAASAGDMLPGLPPRRIHPATRTWLVIPPHPFRYRHVG